MPRLIVLNGPPGVGKTTLARRYVAGHRMALNADIDGVRRMLGRWEDDPNRAGLAARALALVMAREHLGNGHDVVLPQYLGNPAFLADAEAVAREAGAEFFEFVLSDNRDEIVRRFHERTARAEEPTHLDAARTVEQLGGDELLFAMCDRLLLVISARPGATVIQCPEGATEDVYRRLVEVMESR